MVSQLTLSVCALIFRGAIVRLSEPAICCFEAAKLLLYLRLTFLITCIITHTPLTPFS